MSKVLMEIRAGAGGEEAALFAGDLFRMYSRFVEKMNWKIKIYDENAGELGGYKSVSFKISGNSAYESLKNEGGVHRVQRIPKTEKGGRIHTSTASVAILPMPEKSEVQINKNDLTMDFFRSSGKGGQNVNKRQTAIRITHIPSGITVSSQAQRNLEQNKQNALQMLEAKLFKKQMEEKREDIKEERRAQIKEAERAEKIRTYNFPQNRITDHRINKKWHNLEKILDGELKQVIRQTKKLLKN